MHNYHKIVSPWKRTDPKSKTVNTEVFSDEYIEMLKTHTIKNPLYTTDYTATSWMIYYVPSQLGESTMVQVPRDSEYQIYGNNRDGFIISVKLTQS